MSTYKYDELIEMNPFSFGTYKNTKEQTIEFYEHPIHGDSSFIICVCHELKLAADSNFFETDDMIEDHGEYEPWFDENGKLQIGDLNIN